MSLLSRLIERLKPGPPPTDAQLALNVEEASTLYLAARLLETYAEGRRAQEAAALIPRLAAILPPTLRVETEALGGVIAAIRPIYRLHLDDPRLLALQQGIDQRRVLRVVIDEPRGETISHDLEPYALRFSGGVWLIEGYSRTAARKRTFRVSRISAVEPLAETFEARFTAAPAPRIEVRVRFEPSVLLRVREQQHPAFRKEEPALGQRSRVMVYEIEALDEMIGWLLSWGAEAEVIGPDALREAVLEAAQRIVARLS